MLWVERKTWVLLSLCVVTKLNIDVLILLSLSLILKYIDIDNSTGSYGLPDIIRRVFHATYIWLVSSLAEKFYTPVPKGRIAIIYTIFLHVLLAYRIKVLILHHDFSHFLNVLPWQVIQLLQNNWIIVHVDCLRGGDKCQIPTWDA